METVYRLNTKELGTSFIDSIRDAYPNQNIEILVREQNETEYLCRSLSNQERLDELIQDVEKGRNIRYFKTLEDAIACAQSKN